MRIFERGRAVYKKEAPKVAGAIIIERAKNFFWSIKGLLDIPLGRSVLTFRRMSRFRPAVG